MLVRWGVIALIASYALLSAFAVRAEERSVGPGSRAEATEIIADMRRIVTSDGIERLEAIEINGIRQWISIRGTNARNPVLLMIHGGPGWVSMPTSWYFQRGWEEYFTVVQWDQRGAGKTYLEYAPEEVAPTLTEAQIVDDAEALVGWLRAEFGQEKIFVLGHSWGSQVGLQLASRRPEWLHAYVGVGQVIHTPESERRGWAFAHGEALKAGNKEAIEALEAIAPYAQAGSAIPMEHLDVQRRWLNFYGGMVHGRTGGDAESAAIKLAPEYSDRDVANVWKANSFSMAHLMPSILGADLRSLDSFNCPVVLFLGRHDHNVSSTVAAEWFQSVSAPGKELVWFENSAHEMFNEEPGRFLVSLVQVVRPFASRSDRTSPNPSGAGSGVPK